MSFYFYKGIDINTITYTSGGTANTPYGSNFITVPAPAGQNLSLPLNLGYQINNTDISNICTAPYTTINVGTTINIPNVAPYAKSFRYVSVGGGGGGAGRGGNANTKYNFTGDGATGYGGDGGDGGYAVYTNSPEIPIVLGQNQIIISIGAGGNTGNNGADNVFTSAALENHKTTGGNGNVGGNGFPTNINYGGSYTSFGGNGGNGGNGANADYIYNSDLIPSVQCNAFGGNSGSDGNVNPYTIPTQYPPLGTAGNPGSGATSNTNATPGNPGVCRIIWLYD